MSDRPVVTRFAPSPDRLSAYRRRAHGPVQLALCTRSRRQVSAADRGYRSCTLDSRGDRGDLSRPDMARPRLGRRADQPVRRAWTATQRSRMQMLAKGAAYKCFSTQEEIAGVSRRRQGRGSLDPVPLALARCRSRHTSRRALCDPREGPDRGRNGDPDRVQGDVTIRNDPNSTT